MTDNTSTDVWHRGWMPKKQNILEVDHAKHLMALVDNHPINHILDIGCGDEQIQKCFPYAGYTGIDLPMFDIYKDHLKDYVFLADTILANALLDVLKHPFVGLFNILQAGQLGQIKTIIIHRQEFAEKTHVEKRPAYGGWTWHSKIKRKTFDKMINFYNFEVSRELSCTFDNWNEGGKSLLLTKRQNDTTI